MPCCYYYAPTLFTLFSPIFLAISALHADAMLSFWCHAICHWHAMTYALLILLLAPMPLRDIYFRYYHFLPPLIRTLLLHYCDARYYFHADISLHTCRWSESEHGAFIITLRAERQRWAIIFPPWWCLRQERAPLFFITLRHATYYYYYAYFVAIIIYAVATLLMLLYYTLLRYMLRLCLVNINITLHYYTLRQQAPLRCHYYYY